MGVVVVDKVVEDLERVDLMAKGAAAMAVAVLVGKSSYTCTRVLLQEGGVVAEEVAMAWVETGVEVLGVEAMAVVDLVVVVEEAMAERVVVVKAMADRVTAEATATAAEMGRVTPTVEAATARGAAARAQTERSHRLRPASTRRRPRSAFDAYSASKSCSSTPCTVRLRRAY